MKRYLKKIFKEKYIKDAIVDQRNSFLNIGSKNCPRIDDSVNPPILIEADHEYIEYVRGYGFGIIMPTGILGDNIYKATRENEPFVSIQAILLDEYEITASIEEIKKVYLKMIKNGECKICDCEYDSKYKYVDIKNKIIDKTRFWEKVWNFDTYIIKNTLLFGIILLLIFILNQTLTIYSKPLDIGWYIGMVVTLWSIFFNKPKS